MTDSKKSEILSFIQNYPNCSSIFDLLDKTPVFTDAELEKLAGLQKKFAVNSAQLTPFEYAKEMERLAIDLSWKSSQIEGNTYSLLETERLLKEKETASGKTKEEALMLLNHKDTIDFIVENPDYVDPLAISKIEDIHSLLMKDLAVDKNLRKGRVGITGTKYRPLDNEFQLREALDAACLLVNKKAMLLFYEQNNLSGFKQIFLSQFEFAVKTYF